MAVTITDFRWERMFRAVEKVRDRLRRVCDALEQAGIPYAVIGGNAVAAWVSQVDEAAVRNTQDVDLLLREEDLPRPIETLSKSGFIYQTVARIPMFLDGPAAKPRDAVHIHFAGKKVRDQDLLPAPDVTDCEQQQQRQVLSLASLVRMKLTLFCDKDRTHLRDILEVGLIDDSWVSQLPPELGTRLQELLDNPEG